MKNFVKTVRAEKVRGIAQMIGGTVTNSVGALSLNPVKSLSGLIKLYKPQISGTIASYTALAGINQGIELFFYQPNVIQSFIETSDKASTLPVVLSPLIHEGRPFTAGLETTEAVWQVSTAGVMRGWHELKKGAALFLENEFGFDLSDNIETSAIDSQLEDVR